MLAMRIRLLIVLRRQEALWDKVTLMDAYDAGGLTFEIASLLSDPAAVGKMARVQAELRR